MSNGDKIGNCVYCKQDTGGNHEITCPLYPNNLIYTSAVATTACACACGEYPCQCGMGGVVSITFPCQNCDQLTEDKAKLEDRVGELEGYKIAIDDALVVNFLGVASGNALEDLAKLVKWETKIALDPAISEQAAKLVDRAETAEAKVKALREGLQLIADHRKGIHTHNSCFCAGCEAAKILEATDAK